MSELKKELLEPAITKKRIIGVIILAGVLIFAFVYSVYAFSLIFDTQRIEPSDELDKAEYEDAEVLERHFPIDLDDLLDWLIDNLDDYDPGDLDLDDLEDLGIDIDDIDPDDLAELADLIDSEDVNDFLEELLDGNIDNFDLTIAGLIIAALLFSDEEVFRVYDYPRPIDAEREDILWKFECFDQFNGDGWISTVPMEPTVYPDNADPGSDVNRIQRSLSVIEGSNSMVFGSRFNELVNPSIIQDSIVASYLDQTMYYYDELGCSSIDLYFDLEEGITTYDVNMTYNVFGIDLRTNEEINQTAVSTDQNPSDPDFQKFLQLPGGVSSYINSNPFFLADWNNLDAIININDNAFMVANKIRNYLQLNFDLSFNELVNDEPEDGEDIVYWFCEHDEGLYSEFASAFCAFTRSFGVASRFVDGFNSRLIEEFNDTNGNPYYPILYQNIYNWAEIYVPSTGATAPGRWVQMDLLYDSYGGGSPIQILNYNLSIDVNSTVFKRGEFANITAVLSSDMGDPVYPREIHFTDVTTGRNLGSNFTNINGRASIEVLIDDINHVVGPNVIEASYLSVENETYYIVDDEIRVDFISASPQEVNISESDPRTQVEGYLRDNNTNQGVENALITFVLLYKGTTIPVLNAFVFPYSTYTSMNGYFNTSLEIRSQVQYGEYDLRADFYGEWVISPNYQPQYIPYPSINDTSDTIDFNVSKQINYELYFSINGQPTDYPADPDPGTLLNVNRYSQLNFTARVLDADDGIPLSDILVEFYDYTNGHILIGSDVSNNNGKASILYTVGDTNKSGPCLVYAKVSNVLNYSYYIVNESINFDSILGPISATVDIKASVPQFNVSCQLIDDFNNPINYTEIYLRMFRGGFEYTNYLTPVNPDTPNPSGSNFFNVYRNVTLSTPAANYTLRLDFNGTFDFLNYPYPYLFNLDYFSNSYGIPTELRVFDPDDIQIQLSVEGNPTREFYDETYPPQKYERGQIAHFQVNITQSGSPASGSVSIYDDYSGMLLDNYTYIGGENGFVQFDISTNKFYHAGIHRIRVQLDGYAAANYTYILINETVSVYAISSIQTTGTDNVVIRDNGGFIVNGWISENNTGLRGLIVRLVLFNKTNDNVSSYLTGNPYAVTDANGNFTIQIDGINAIAPIGEYYIKVDFNGSIYISETPGILPIYNYMDISQSSSSVPLNITGATVITEIGYSSNLEFVAPDQWIVGDILYVLGNLTWDNSSILANMYVNVTVQLLDGTVIGYNDTVKTNGLGEFNGLLQVSEIWPTDRSDTKIVVYFDPEIPANNLKFAEQTNTTFI
ncbi:MAG: transglutaminase domain-containing protein [Promethearchaeota archaeon]|nr:MAG: transglutaminase domain-containing protein [Candidatus Lokiarchaeota archaeon]